VTRLTALIFMLISVCGAAAHGAELVRAIDHPNFSRLLFSIDSDSTWELTQTGRSASLRLPGRKERFDVTSVFDRMSRSRILSISQAVDSDALLVELELGCDCAVTASPITPGQLAIDVLRRDRPAADPGVDESGLEQVGNAVLKLDRNAQFGQVHEAPTSDDKLPATFQTSNESISVTESTDRDVLAAEDLAGSVAAEARLLEAEIGGVVAEGLLSPDITLSLPDPASGPESTLIESRDSDERELPSVPPMKQSTAAFSVPPTQARVTSAFEPVREWHQLQAENSDWVGSCDEFVIDQRNTSESVSVSQQIGNLRSRLVREDGSTDPMSLRALAQLYISVGFGVEAAAVLEQVAAPDSYDTVLIDIAKVIDNEETSGALAVVARDCPKQLGFWMIAAGESFDVASEDDLVAGLSVLPETIRRSIAELVVSNARDRFPTLDQRIERLVERSPQTDYPEMPETMVERLTKAADNLIADRSLGSVSTSLPNAAIPSQTGPRAESHASTEFGREVASQTLDLDLAITAKELKGTDSGLKAVISMAEYSARNGNILSAIEALDDAIEDYDFGKQEIYEAGTRILMDAENGGSNSQYILAALAGRKFLLNPDHQQYVDAKIAELGLPNLIVFR
jgi:hypothetical protein